MFFSCCDCFLVFLWFKLTALRVLGLLSQNSYTCAYFVGCVFDCDSLCSLALLSLNRKPFGNPLAHPCACACASAFACVHKCILNGYQLLCCGHKHPFHSLHCIVKDSHWRVAPKRAHLPLAFFNNRSRCAPGPETGACLSRQPL